MQVKVVKFGGSSLADAEHFRQVASIIKADPARRYVVPSAPGKRFKEDTKVTDMLYACYEKIRNHENIDELYDQIKARYNGIIAYLGLDFDIIGELEYVKNAMMHRSGRDFAASRGEYLNGLILSKYLGYSFIDAENVIFFRDNGTFDEEKTNRVLAEELMQYKNAVIPGFYGVMPNGTIKTFSRGGSDITGSIVARAAQADLYENWTDVSGFMMGDPRVLDNPCPIETITYRELRELSYMGATVLHEDAIFPVRYAGIPINIRNTNHPGEPGTMIQQSRRVVPGTVVGIASADGFCNIVVEKYLMNRELGFGRRLLQILEEEGVSYEHMPSGVDSQCIVIKEQYLSKDIERRVVQTIKRELQPDFVTVERDFTMLMIVGEGMCYTPGMLAKACLALASAGISMSMVNQGSSEVSFMIAIRSKDRDSAVQALYKAFFS